jgi:hypothetical protein
MQPITRRAISETLKGSDWRHWLLSGAFALALAFAGWHAFRFVRDAIYWDVNRDEPIRGWMNVGFVAHSYHLPPPLLYEALGLPAKPPDKRPLSEIAVAQGKSIGDIEKILGDAIVHARSTVPAASEPPGAARP